MTLPVAPQPGPDFAMARNIVQVFEDDYSGFVVGEERDAALADCTSLRAILDVAESALLRAVETEKLLREDAEIMGSVRREETRAIAALATWCSTGGLPVEYIGRHGSVDEAIPAYVAALLESERELREENTKVKQCPGCEGQGFYETGRLDASDCEITLPCSCGDGSMVGFVAFLRAELTGLRKYLDQRASGNDPMTMELRAALARAEQDAGRWRAVAPILRVRNHALSFGAETPPTVVRRQTWLESREPFNGFLLTVEAYADALVDASRAGASPPTTEGKPE